MKMRTFVLVIAAAAFLSGCAASVFNQPVALSTKSVAAKYWKPVGRISTEYTNSLFIIIPIPSDPRNAYDDLLKIAKEKGANAVTDVQLHDKNLFAWMFPGIVVDTWELKGTAIKVE
jgi:hypothetical protein